MTDDDGSVDDVEDASSVGDDGGDGDEMGGGVDDTEPLGDLRNRVVDDADQPPAAFPETAGGVNDGGSAASDDDGAHAERPALNPASEETRSGPLGDLAAGVDERRQRKTKTDEELFDEVDVGEVDSDALWEQVRTEEPDVSPRGDRRVRDVDKRKYCQRCPHFAEPPAVDCTHDGTDILEQVDMETFKVADCPIVLEDERLEDATTAESEITD